MLTRTTVLLAVALCTSVCAGTAVADTWDHLHLTVSDTADAAKWYAKNFDGKVTKSGPFDAVLFGSNLVKFRSAKGEVLPDIAKFLELRPERGVAAPRLVDVYRRIVKLDGQNPEALYFAGLGEAQAGNTETAVSHWERLLSMLDPGSEAYGVIEDRLKDLRAGP